MGRPPLNHATTAIENFLRKHIAPEGNIVFYPLGDSEGLRQDADEYIPYNVVPDGDHCWAFWILYEDTTSYVHPDLRIEWLGTLYDPQLQTE